MGDNLIKLYGGLNIGTTCHALVFYDFGKDLRQQCPYSTDSIQGQQLFRSKLNEFVELFPNLCLHNPKTEKLKIEAGKSRLSPIAFLTKNASNGFGSNKRRNKEHVRFVST